MEIMMTMNFSGSCKAHGHLACRPIGSSWILD